MYPFYRFLCFHFLVSKFFHFLVSIWRWNLYLEKCFCCLIFFYLQFVFISKNFRSLF